MPDDAYNSAMERVGSIQAAFDDQTRQQAQEWAEVNESMQRAREFKREREDERVAREQELVERERARDERDAQRELELAEQRAKDQADERQRRKWEFRRWAFTTCLAASSVVYTVLHSHGVL